MVDGHNKIVEELSKENKFMKNELLDALDLKAGKGPTALRILKEEIERLKESNKELVENLNEHKKLLKSMGVIKGVN